MDTESRQPSASEQLRRMPTAHPHRAPLVLVVGAGCVGLTTAVRLLEAGLVVRVVAQHLPSDELNPHYASTAAGAHHLSFAANGDWRQRFLDQRTFDVFWNESRDAEQAARFGLLRLTQTEFYTEGEKHLRFLEQLPDFIVHDAAKLPPFAQHSCSFTSLTMEPTLYLAYLTKRIERLGGTITRIPKADSLKHAIVLAALRASPAAVVNCTGLGSRSLSDVNDKTVVPVRGQVLAVRAPWVRSGWTRQVGSLSGGEGGQRTYVIPRASGEVIIGGTREAEDWHESPRPETTVDIVRRAVEICPQLEQRPTAKPYTASLPASAKHQTEHVDLQSIAIKSVVGFRPTRAAGIRLELDLNGVKGVDDTATESASIPLIHNYGHGGYGWQCCWGCAEEATRIAREVVSFPSLAIVKSKL